MRRTPGLLSVACLLAVAVAAQERPLPEREARVALVRTLRRSSTSEFSGYRKFSVDTATAYQPPTTQ